jgi:hypothetical protein
MEGADIRYSAHGEIHRAFADPVQGFLAAPHLPSLFTLSRAREAEPSAARGIRAERLDRGAPEAPKLAALLPGLAKWDVGFVIGGLISIIGKSWNYRSAEANFDLFCLISKRRVMNRL